MAFHGKPLVFYLTNKTLEVFDVGRNIQSVLTFSRAAYHFAEVGDEKKFADELISFYHALKSPSNKGVVFLSAELVFSAKLSRDSGLEKTLSTFVQSVPIDPAERTLVSLRNKNIQEVYVTNRVAYESIASTAKQSNIKIDSVLPMNIVKEVPAQGAPFTMAHAKLLTNTYPGYEKYDFLNTKPRLKKTVTVHTASAQSQQGEHTSMTRQYVYLGLSLTMLLTATAYYLLWSGTIQNPWFVQSVSQSRSTTQVAAPVGETPTLSPTPTIAFLRDKTRIRVQIVRGSQTEELAVKTKNALQDIGYVLIDINANSPSTGSAALIRYTDRIPALSVEEVVTKLGVIFADVSQERSTDTMYDMTIVTGEEK